MTIKAARLFFIVFLIGLLQSCLPPEVTLKNETKLEQTPKLKKPIKTHLAEVKIIEKKLDEHSEEFNPRKTKEKETNATYFIKESAGTLSKSSNEKKSYNDKKTPVANNFTERRKHSSQSNLIKSVKSASGKMDSQSVDEEQIPSKSQTSSVSNLKNLQSQSSPRDTSQSPIEMGKSNANKKGFEPTQQNIQPKPEDDIIARQLRDAAISENDLELKRKLWNEYERYRSNL